MPVISLKIGTLTAEQKKEIIRVLTKKTAEITKIPENAFTVLIQEFPDDNIGIGGVDIGEIKSKHRK